MGKKKIPVKTGGKQVERDKRGKFLPGSKANPNGRPKGSISITTIIKRLLQDEQISLKDGKKINQERNKILRHYERAKTFRTCKD